MTEVVRQHEVVMPRLADSMQEGTILRWLGVAGEVVEAGQELVEIETDKATVTYEAPQAGRLEILAGAGEAVPVGGLIARIGAYDSDGAAGPEPNGAVGPEPNGTAAGRHVKASPLARRIAAERGLDLAAVTGSGPGGRIVRVDVEGEPTAAMPRRRLVKPAMGPGAQQAPKGEPTVQSLSSTQQMIARRMAASRQTVPEFSVERTIDMEACVELRARLAELTGEDHIRPSYNDLLVKAAALALREHPRVNGSYRDGQFELHQRVNVGVAVAAADALIVPTVFDADAKRLLEIARETSALSERARTRTITPAELSAATFTISNLGMLGVDRFTAVINPPQAAILAVGAVSPRPVARGGEVVIRHMLDARLTCDHRILYGADAARFLARLCQLLEQPLALCLTG